MTAFFMPCVNGPYIKQDFDKSKARYVKDPNVVILKYYSWFERAAQQAAMHNVDKYYLIVGLQNEMKTTLELMQMIFPQFFPTTSDAQSNSI